MNYYKNERTFLVVLTAGFLFPFAGGFFSLGRRRGNSFGPLFFFSPGRKVFHIGATNTKNSSFWERVGWKNSFFHPIKRKDIHNNHFAVEIGSSIFSFAPHQRQRSGILGSNSFRPGEESKGGGRGRLLGRFKEMGFLREGGNRNPPSLNRVFSPFLHAQKWGKGPGCISPEENIFAPASKRKRNGGEIRTSKNNATFPRAEKENDRTSKTPPLQKKEAEHSLRFLFSFSFSVPCVFRGFPCGRSWRTPPGDWPARYARPNRTGLKACPPR